MQCVCWDCANLCKIRTDDPGRGLSFSDISEHVQEIYGISVSAAAISVITDKIIDTVKAWQQRPLDSHYPFVWTGLTIGASWSQLEIFRPLNTSRCIITFCRVIRGGMTHTPESPDYPGRFKLIRPGYTQHFSKTNNELWASGADDPHRAREFDAVSGMIGC